MNSSIFNFDMIKLFSKIVLIIVLFILANRITYFATNEAEVWHHDVGDFKKSALLGSADEHNMLILGSSRIDRGVIPEAFDSSLADTSLHLFNFGMGRLIIPVVFYVYEEFLNNDSLQLRIVFMELSANKVDEIFFKSGMLDFYDLKEYTFSVNSHFQELSTNTSHHIDQIFQHSKAITTKILGGMDLVAHFSSPQNYSGDPTLMFNSGFILSDNKIPKEKLKKQREILIQDTTWIDLNKARDFNAFSHKYDPADYNRVYYEKIEQLIQFSEKKGVQLIFLMPMRFLTDREANLVPRVFQKIAAPNKIEMPINKELKELYTIKYSMDQIHLNETGARKYSRLLAIEFNKHQQLHGPY